jgi:hypothetical protein
MRVLLFTTIGLFLLSTVVMIHEIRGTLDTLENLLQRYGKSDFARSMKKDFSILGLTAISSGLCAIGIAWFI